MGFHQPIFLLNGSDFFAIQISSSHSLICLWMSWFFNYRRIRVSINQSPRGFSHITLFASSFETTRRPTSLKIGWVRITLRFSITKTQYYSYKIIIPSKPIYRNNNLLKLWAKKDQAATKPSYQKTKLSKNHGSWFILHYEVKT